MDKFTSTPLPYNHLTIGQAADYLGLSIKTLRRWDSEGKLCPDRNQLNQRLYDPRALSSVKNGLPNLPTHSIKSNSSTAKLYSISQVALKLGVSVKTIRRWEKIGKIHSVRNKLNQRLFTLDAIHTTQTRVEADRYLPEITKTSNNYWRTWPMVRSFIVGSGMVIATLALLIIAGATRDQFLRPDIQPHSMVQQLTDTKLMTSNTSASETLDLPHLDNSSLQQSSPKSMIFLGAESSPPIVATNTYDRLASENLSAPSLATEAAQMLITSIIIEYLKQNPSITATDITLSDLLKTDLRPPLAALDVTTDRLTDPPNTSSSNLPLTGLDPLGDLDISPTPDASPTPTPSPTETLRSGQSLLPAGSTLVTLPISSTTSPANISITFLSDYAPATRYWVTTTDTGFALHLDQPVTQDTPFSWIAH